MKDIHKTTRGRSNNIYSNGHAQPNEQWEASLKFDGKGMGTEDNEY